MFATHLKNPSSTSRLISAALLLFVFLLPFHIHYSVTAQVSKECSCVHGTRAQLAPSVKISISIPVFRTDGPVVQDTFGWAAEGSNLRDARAPPSARSA